MRDGIVMTNTSLYKKNTQIQSIRIGVIGVGNMGQNHTRVLSLMKGIELVGVADTNIDGGFETA